MNKNNFYLCLNILNILLCLCVYIIILVFYVVFSIAENNFIPIGLIFLSIFVKIIFLYAIFYTFEKFFPNFILSKVALELKTNVNIRKPTLILAFTYDVVIMLFYVLFFSIESYSFEWEYILAYEIMTFGGVWIFYVALFTIWKIQGKFKM